MSLETSNRNRDSIGATVRLAAHYFKELEAYNDQYIEGGDLLLQSLAQFDSDWLCIAHAQRAIVTLTSVVDSRDMPQSGNHRLAIELCNAYPDAGAYLISLRLSAIDRIIWLEEALSASSRLQRNITTQAHLGNLGLAYYELGSHDRAIEYFENAKKLAAEIGDRRHEGTWSGNLGIAYAAIGKHRLAIKYYEEHLAIAKEIGDRRGEANALGNIGVSYAAVGQSESPLEYYLQQLEITKEIGDQRGECNAILNIGLSHHDLGEVQKAQAYLEMCLAYARKIGDRQTENIALGSLGHLYIEHGSFQSALATLSRALQIARNIGDLRSEIRHMSIQMIAHRELGEYSYAIEIGEKALDIAQKIDSRLEKAYINWQLGLIFEQLEQWERAIEHFQFNMNYEKAIGHPNTENSLEKINLIRHQLENSIT